MADLINRLEALQKGFSDNESGSSNLESQYVFVECAIGAYKVGNTKEATRLLLNALSSSVSNRHNRTVVSWLLGCVHWLDTSKVNEAILSWESGLNDFRILLHSFQNNSEWVMWYQEKSKEMSETIEYAVERNFPCSPKRYSSNRQTLAVRK